MSAALSGISLTHRVFSTSVFLVVLVFSVFSLFPSNFLSASSNGHYTYFIQSPHNDPLSVEVDPGSTVKDVKRICNFVGANLRFKGVPMLNTDTLSGKGVAGGDTVHAFPANKERTGDAAYQAQHRLGKGKTLRSTAHPYLHQQTQAVVMDTSRRTQELVNSRCDRLEQQNGHATRTS